MRGGLLDDDELATAQTAITTFVRETVASADADGVVVGLSGGVDSTLTALLAVEALGSDHVLGVSMPCAETSDADASEARTIADGLGIEFREVSLAAILDGFEDAVRAAVTPSSSRAARSTAETAVAGDRVEPAASAATGRPDSPQRRRSRVRGNAASRMRMTALYYAANSRGLLVLGTANRTELFTGYFTKHGDGGADLFPLGGLYKTEVRALARRAGVPQRIVGKAPTAGFRPGQTDEADLGARYDVIDRLFQRVVDEETDVEAAIRDLSIDRSAAETLLDRVTETDHKRRRPPVCSVADRPGFPSASDGS